MHNTAAMLGIREKFKEDRSYYRLQDSIWLALESTSDSLQRGFNCAEAFLAHNTLGRNAISNISYIKGRSKTHSLAVHHNDNHFTPKQLSKFEYLYHSIVNNIRYGRTDPLRSLDRVQLILCNLYHYDIINYLIVYFLIYTALISVYIVLWLMTPSIFSSLSSTVDSAFLYWIIAYTITWFIANSMAFANTEKVETLKTFAMLNSCVCLFRSTISIALSSLSRERNSDAIDRGWSKKKSQIDNLYDYTQYEYEPSPFYGLSSDSIGLGQTAHSFDFIGERPTRAMTKEKALKHLNDPNNYPPECRDEVIGTCSAVTSELIELLKLINLIYTLKDEHHSIVDENLSKFATSVSNVVELLEKLPEQCSVKSSRSYLILNGELNELRKYLTTNITTRSQVKFKYRNFNSLRIILWIFVYAFSPLLLVSSTGYYSIIAYPITSTLINSYLMLSDVTKEHHIKFSIVPGINDAGINEFNQYLLILQELPSLWTQSSMLLNDIRYHIRGYV